ncbi:MAG: hypothetical protein DCF25_20870 [Leptolyngbya foveolarum]|uniref:Porin n=1 Tax=Leptolyngbya foveolarum TaxID=47253 RepID=A0A2W4TRI8_9CYAN|nr:MAG: hypothetical protein DCF25_20870 [Leptolyngbya foveolarum]
MNKLPQKTATSLTLAVSCVLSIMAVGAEANMIDLSIDGLKGSPHNLGLNASPTNFPALNALGLSAAAPTVAMAKTARFSPSGLVPSFINQPKAALETTAPETTALETTDRETTEPEAVVLETVALETVASERSGLEVVSLKPTTIPTVAAPFGEVFPLEVAQAPNNTAAPLSDQEIREQLLTTPNTAAAPNLDVLDRRPQPVPSSTFITPNAYGADWGDFYIGTAGATEDTKDGLDASASVGMGFGNAVDNVGVELNVGIISIDGFADDGTVGFNVHKIFPRANNLGSRIK